MFTALSSYSTDLSPSATSEFMSLLDSSYQLSTSIPSSSLFINDSSQFSLIETSLGLTISSTLKPSPLGPSGTVSSMPDHEASLLLTLSFNVTRSISQPVNQIMPTNLVKESLSFTPESTAIIVIESSSDFPSTAVIGTVSSIPDPTVVMEPSKRFPLTAVIGVIMGIVAVSALTIVIAVV